MVTATAAAGLATVPRLWPGSTVVCLAPGPSLTSADAELARACAKTIVINDAVRVMPFADVLYSSDQYWLPKQNGVPTFRGLKFAVAPRQGQARHPFEKWPDIQVVANTGYDGLETSPTGLRTGKNSGYAAINLAVHLGAARILLLGYDMGIGPNGEAHFDGLKKPNPPYESFRAVYKTLVEPLRSLGVVVVNCSRQTALTVFPRLSLAEGLS